MIEKKQDFFGFSLNIYQNFLIDKKSFIFQMKLKEKTF